MIEVGLRVVLRVLLLIGLHVVAGYIGFITIIIRWIGLHVASSFIGFD